MEEGGSPRARPVVGAEVIVYGLRKQRQFNGRLCVVEEGCSAREDDVAADGSAREDDDGAAGGAAIGGGGGEADGQQRRWELRVKMDDSLAGTGRDDPLGGRLIRPPASSVFANTEAGRGELLAERAADK